LAAVGGAEPNQAEFVARRDDGQDQRMNLGGSFPKVAVSGLGLVSDLVFVTPEPATLGLCLLAVARLRRWGRGGPKKIGGGIGEA
jgi:hypothetical protein